MRLIIVLFSLLITENSFSQSNCESFDGSWLYIAHSDLDGNNKEWRSKRFGENDMTLHLNDSLKSFGAKSGINVFNGTYECFGQQLEVKPGLSSLAGEHGASRLFYDCINKASSFKFKNDTLIILSYENSAVLYFLKKE